MRKILFLLVLVSYNALSTDLKVGRLLSPELFVNVSEELSISYEIDNINVLTAEQYTGLVTITNNQTNVTDFTYLGEYADLEAFNSTQINVPTKWTPTELGSYTISILIEFEDDIDLSNNSEEFIIEVGSSGCTTSHTWEEGIGLTIRKSLSHFPNASDLEGKMKPGDIIGIQCLVEDLDELIVNCGCGEGINSKFVKHFYDVVEYDWSLVGQGTLIQSDVGDKNAVFYKIPVCPNKAVGSEVTITAEILLTARNNETALKADKPISGKVTLTITYCPERYYPEKGEPSWDPTALKVTAEIEPLETGESNEFTDSDNGSCEPQPLTFDKSTPITMVNNITEKPVDGVCPDYAVLLSALAEDEDKITIECGPEIESSECTEKSDNTITIKDKLKYTWTVTGGKGEFPLGNTGSSVVFRKSQSENADITCEISNEFSMADDPKIIIKYKVTKASKPKAFVGLGDDENSLNLAKLFHENILDSDDVYGGRSSAFFAIAESMKDKYDAAGYDVTFAEYTSNSQLYDVLRDPCYQAFCIVSHGTGGNVVLTGGTSKNYLDEFTNFMARKDNEATWGCRRNPSIRDVQLLACNALDSDWGMAFNCNARIYGYKEAKFIATLRLYAYIQFKPYPPLTLALP